MTKAVKFLARSAMIAAIYFVLSAVLAPISFGLVQARVSEALGLLPVMTSTGIAGVTVGCILTNAWGAASGANILGAADILFGSLATLVAAIITRSLKGVRIKGLAIPASLPPVLVNAVVIGAEFSFAETGQIFGPAFLINAVYIGLGQLLSCTVLGVAMVYIFEKKGLDKRLFS